MTDDKNNDIMSNGMSKSVLIKSHEFTRSIYTEKFLEGIANFDLVENLLTKVECCIKYKTVEGWTDEELTPLFDIIEVLENEVLRRLEKGQKIGDLLIQLRNL